MFCGKNVSIRMLLLAPATVLSESLKSNGQIGFANFNIKQYCCFRAPMQIQALIPSVFYFGSDKVISLEFILLQNSDSWTGVSIDQIYYKAKKLELYITLRQFISLTQKQASFKSNLHI